MATLLIWLGVLGIAAVLLFKAIVVVPTFHYGLVRRFRKLTGRAIGPGLNFVFPFFEDVLLENAGGDAITFAIQRKEISADVFSKPDLAGATVGVKIKGVVVYRVDLGLVPAFATVGKDALRGISDGIEKLLGVIAGRKDAMEFISKRDQIDLLLNCELRMRKPPHLTPEKYEPTAYKAGDVVSPEDRLEFYERHYGAIKNDLKAEKSRPDDRSSIETRYGIDIETFDLTLVDFSSESRASFEKKQRAVAEMAAADEVTRKVQTIYQDLRAKGVPEQEAINTALALVGKADRKVFSIEGLKGLGNIFGGDRP